MDGSILYPIRHQNIEELERPYQQGAISKEDLSDPSRVPLTKVFENALQYDKIVVMNWVTAKTSIDFMQRLVRGAFAQIQSLSTLRNLIQKGIITERTKSMDGDTILHAVVRKRNLEMVKYLLERLNFLGARNSRGEDALFYAAGCVPDPQRDVIRKMVQAGFSVDTWDSEGESPIDKILRDDRALDKKVEHTLMLLDLGMTMDSRTVQNAMDNSSRNQFFEIMYQKCQQRQRLLLTEEKNLQ